jgi:hypothetical protein
MNLDIQLHRKHDRFNIFVQNVDSENFNLFIHDTSKDSVELIFMGEYKIPLYDEVIDEFIPDLDEWE